MHKDDFDIDPSVEWISVEENQRSQKPPRKTFYILLVTGAFFLGLLVLVLMVRQAIRIAQSSGNNVTVARLRSPEELRSESVRTFKAFDATVDPLAKLSPVQQQERQSIAGFFKIIEACAQEDDSERFREHIDFDRFLKRIEITGRLKDFNRFDKRYLRGELTNSLDVNSQWSRLVITKVLTPTDDPLTRIVYAYSWDNQDDVQMEERFLVVSEDGNWKVYDWCRLDLGLYESEEWSILALYVNHPLMEGYNRWGTLLSEADGLFVEGDREAAKEKMRLAEDEMVPPEAEDYHWALTGYRWQMYGETKEAKRCFLKVRRPENVPGTYYGLMNSHRWIDKERALEYGNLYEKSVGPTPDLCNAKARLLESLNLQDQAVEEWKKVLRIQPVDEEALQSLFLALPEKDKTAFLPYLVSLENPSTAIASIALPVGWQDYSGLQYLADYLRDSAPENPGTYYVLGLVASLDGNYQNAADYFRLAFKSEQDQEVAQEYVDQYVEAMSNLGLGVAAWKSVPNPVETFQTIAYSYEEEESLLSEQEFLDLVEAYQKRYPKAVDGFYYRATLAMNEHRYQDAEKILRDGLAQTKPATDEEDSAYDRETLADLLSTVLLKLDRLQEAYEVEGDRKDRFTQLGHFALSDDKWDDLRLLIKMHRKTEADDPQLNYFAGELAAEQKSWDAALREMKVGFEKASEEGQWFNEYRLEDIYVEADRWLEYYREADDQKVVFSSLARRFIDDENWDAFEALVTEHQRQWPQDLRITKKKTYVYWQRKDFQACIPRIYALLECKDDEVVATYEKDIYKSRLLDAFLRTGDVDRALTHAKNIRDDDNDYAPLAIVHAITGNIPEAVRLASQSADENESARQFYTDDNVGHIFLSDRFEQLQLQYPVGLQYDTTPASVLFLSEAPWQLDTNLLTAAMQDFELSTPASIQAVKSIRKDVTQSFVIRIGKASIWVATGSGDFDPNWKLADPAEPLSLQATQCQNWLTVGIAGWTSPQREQVEDLVRKLAVKLTNESTKFFCPADLWYGGSASAYPARTEFLAEWEAKNKNNSYASEELEFDISYRNRNLVSDRQFESELRRAVRAIESSPDAKLEVLAYLAGEARIDPLRVTVSSVTRKYGNLQFIGQLANSSKLLPELREGLNVTIDYNEVRAWRLNSGPPVIRDP